MAKARKTVRRCLKRAKTSKGRCLKWAKTPTTARKAIKRRATKARRGSKCLGAPFRMKTSAGIKCACVARSKRGTLVPKFVKMTKCNPRGTKVMTYKEARRQYTPMVRV